MSANLSHTADSESLALAPAEPRALAPYAPAAAAEPPAGDIGAFVSRVVAALNRYKWLILAATVLGLLAGYIATRFIKPRYQVVATVYATPNGRTGASLGPIGEQAMLNNNGWRDLLRSYAVADPVVARLALYLQPASVKDSAVFRDFRINPTTNRFLPGDYTLEVSGGRWTLSDRKGIVNERGTVGDSVGRVAGFAWRPSPQVLGTDDREVKFSVRTPREASVDVLSRLEVAIDDASPLIGVRLSGTAEQKPAATLNAMLTQFVEIASELKKRELVQATSTLGAQLESAQDRLQDAERTLERFRISTIALPSEGGLPAKPGLEMTRDPVFGSYFSQKMELDQLARDRAELEKLARTPPSQMRMDALYAVPTVKADQSAIPLRQTVEEILKGEAELRAARQVFTDSAKQVVDARAQAERLRNQALPQQMGSLIATLRAREAALGSQIGAATRELQGIPQRTIEEGRLRREQVVAADLYTQLRTRYTEANLAQQASIADVKVLDSAVTPLRPNQTKAAQVLGSGLLGGIGLGLVLALLLDRVDRRFRYPDQVTGSLGLQILGVVPVIHQDARKQTPERLAQIVESFRSLRMNVRYASMSDRVTLTVTSPGPGDGKSLIASNLALSFAEGGWRTVIIDGDLRRGQLNATFDLPQGPGLVEYLEGTSLLGEVLQATRHDNLALLASGARHRRGPELLATPRMSQLIAQLSTEFDVVIVDSPPLGAGTDAYALGAATRQLALVMRCGKTDLKMAKAKLAVLDQLPVEVVGAMLNEIDTEGTYQYYSYDAEYAVMDAPAEMETAAIGGGRSTALARRDG
jgi:capsular exopolysaccharide synthesis family protein